RAARDLVELLVGEFIRRLVDLVVHDRAPERCADRRSLLHLRWHRAGVTRIRGRRRKSPAICNEQDAGPVTRPISQQWSTRSDQWVLEMCGPVRTCGPRNRETTSPNEIQTSN